MITTYLRSSSIGSYDLCPARFTISYVFSEKEPPNKAASKGSLVHKVLECLAHSKKCLQDGTESFEDDSDGTIHIKDCEPDSLYERFVGHYEKEASSTWLGRDDFQYEKNLWVNTDYTDCKRWIKTVLESEGGKHDPRNQKIVHPELFFDIELPFEWANYSFDVQGQTLKGTVHLRGSVDLITEEPDGSYLLTDYKTGSPTNFKTKPFRAKSYDELCAEKQFRLYCWVMRHLFPGRDTQFQVFFTRQKFPTLLYIDDDDLNQFMVDLGKTYKEIIHTELPYFAKNSPQTSGPCSFCPWAKIVDESGSTVCDSYERQLTQLGATKLFDKIGNIDKMGKYEGGGKSLILGSGT